MTTREQMAAMIAASLAGKYNLETPVYSDKSKASTVEELRAVVAEMAVKQADALLAELAKTEQQEEAGL